MKLDGEGMANLLTGSRSPSGERGLKCENPDFGRADGESLPIRGAWIEIVSCTAAGVVVSGSLPIRGAWIEIGVFCQIFVGRFGVSFSPFERLFLGRFGFGQSCGLSVIA